IPQRDYYRLMAVFRGALDEHDWTKPFSGRILNLATPEEKQRWQAHNEPLQRHVAELQADIEHRAEPLKQKHFQRRLAQLPAVLREDVRHAIEIPSNQRTGVQRYLAEKFEKTLRIDTSTLKILEPDFKKAVEPI